MLRGKHIVVGVTGGIAAYKSCYLVRELVKAGAGVKVVMTNAATRFVTPLTFSTLSASPVAFDLWSADQSTGSDIGTRHIDLANWGDVLVIAPASANTIAKITGGISDNLLTIVTLASTRPVVLVPTMDKDMFLNETTQRNLALLRERGFFVVPPEEGEHASGLKGPGRLPEIDVIVRFVERVLVQGHQDLKGKRFLVTAGPTYEAIDPVRFLGNRSSGKMGFAVATAAALRGATVTLVAGPVALETPRNVRRIDVTSAGDMAAAVRQLAGKTDVVVMAAAVADFTPAKVAKSKIKKQAGGGAPSLDLVRTPDILEGLGRSKGKKILVGFALESGSGLESAREKMKTKNLDLVVLNSLADHDVFGSDENIVTIIGRRGTPEKLRKLAKLDAANALLDRIQRFF